MREILFRGKRVDNGKEVIGFYFNVPEHHNSDLSGKSIIISINNGLYFEVVPETVGQYTGLTDKNGKKIFEGDIVRTQEYYDRLNSAKAKRKRHIGIVEYVIYKFTDGRCYNAEWRVKIDDYGEYSCGVRSQLYDCEVIGNIHDNPELLEEIK